MDNKKILTVGNLIKNYKNFKAVKNVSFSVQEKEIFALVGPNGAGKSTILKMLATILTPTSGSIVIGGFDLKEDPQKARSVISYLPEEAGAYKNMSGIDYLKFMSAMWTDDPGKQKEYVDFAFELTGLGERLKEKVKNYSKGMTRKLLLARTVMCRPKLAILDEPTSGLDVVNAHEIREIIKNLAQEGMSVILSSHNMLEIEYLSDRIALINEGELIEEGTSEVLRDKYKAGNLEDVFMQATGGNN
jgi:ABC-2 type transport system ATP-binding protein